MTGIPTPGFIRHDCNHAQKTKLTSVGSLGNQPTLAATVPPSQCVLRRFTPDMLMLVNIIAIAVARPFGLGAPALPGLAKPAGANMLPVSRLDDEEA